MLKTKSSIQRARRLRAGVVMGVFAISLALPVLVDEHYYSGAKCFVDCLLENNEVPACVATMPNFSLLAGILALAVGSRGLAGLCGAFSLLFALFVGWAVSEDGKVPRLTVGYYAWVSSMALLLIFAILLPVELNRSNEPVEGPA